MAEAKTKATSERRKSTENEVVTLVIRYLGAMGMVLCVGLVATLIGSTVYAVMNGKELIPNLFSILIAAVAGALGNVTGYIGGLLSNAFRAAGSAADRLLPQQIEDLPGKIGDAVVDSSKDSPVRTSPMGMPADLKNMAAVPWDQAATPLPEIDPAAYAPGASDLPTDLAPVDPATLPAPVKAEYKAPEVRADRPFEAATIHPLADLPDEAFEPSIPIQRGEDDTIDESFFDGGIDGFKEGEDVAPDQTNGGK